MVAPRPLALALALLACLAPVPAVAVPPPAPAPAPALADPGSVPPAADVDSAVPDAGRVANEEPSARAPATAPPPAVDGRRNAVGTGARSRAPLAAPVGRVTLITGQTVVVTRGADGERRYRPAPGSNASFVRVDGGGSTYLFPRGVDLSRFHRSLFDVDFLLAQGYGDAATDRLPVIVDVADDGGAAVAVRSGADVGPAAVTVRATGVEPALGLTAAGAIAGTVPKDRAAAVADRLATAPSVERVYLDYRVRATLDRATARTGTRRARERFGVSGENVTVAVLDTGVDESHPDLDDAEVGERNLVADENTTADLDGHGTHVAGIVAGDGTASNGTLTGYAPNASILDVRVLGADGSGTLSAVVAGIEYAAARDADVISMSLGAPQRVPRYGSVIDPTIEAATARGSLVVASAGNGGPDAGTVGTPGVAADALTVGATVDSGRAVWRTSSRGPTAGGFLKPDLVAPGRRVASANADHESGPAYVNRSGTSMAAPGVAGAAALLLGARDVDPRTAKATLVGTATPSDDATVYDQGGGLLNASRAVGTDLAVTPAPIDFGRYLTNATATRELTLYNRGSRSLSVRLNASARGVVRDTPGAVRLGRRSVTVRPDERVTVPLTVDAGTGADVYGGRVRLVVDGGPNRTTTTRTVPFGYARAHRLTVRKRPGTADGTTAGDLIVYRPSRDVLGGVRTATADGGAVEFRSYGGRANLVSPGENESDGRTVLAAAEVVVDDATRVVLDERDVATYAVDGRALGDGNATDEPNGTDGTSGIGGDPFVARTASAAVATDGLSAAVRLPRSFGSRRPRVRVARDPAVNASVESLFVPRSTPDRTLDAPTTHLLEYGTTGVDGPETFVPNESALASLAVDYHRSRPNRSYSVATSASGGPQAGAGIATPYFRIGDRRTATVRVRPGGTYRIAAGAIRRGGAWTLAAGAASPLRPRAPGAVVETSVNEQPFRVGQYGWTLANGSLEFVTGFQADAAGRPYATSGDVATIEVSVNGSAAIPETRLPAARFPTVSPATPVPVAPGESVAVRTVGRNSLQPLGVRTTALRRATYRPGADSTPPRLRRVAVRNLSLTSVLVPGRATVDVAVADASAVDVAVRVGPSLGDRPFRDGTGRAATVTPTGSNGSVDAFAAVVPVAPTDQPLDVAVRARDGRGNLLRTVTRDAVRVGPPSTVRFDGTVVARDASTVPVAGVTHVGGPFRVALRQRSNGSPSAPVGVSATLAPGRRGPIAVDLTETVGPDDDLATLGGPTTLVAQVYEAAAGGTLGRAITVDGEPVRSTATVVPGPPFASGVPGVSSRPPTDPDGDGRYEDVDGDGDVDFLDVVGLLFADREAVDADPAGAAFDFDSDGDVDFLDVIDLLFAA